ncbi:MAG: ATPase, T2SS/T4P/T4SS family [Bacilli bacterium]
MDDNLFTNVDFGELKPYVEDNDITDISYSNNGQLWIRSLSKGSYRVESHKVNNQLVEKLAFQCANIVGKVFNMAHPFLDAEGIELRMNFIHSSIARNGVAMVIRKAPAKIRLQKSKILEDKYITLDIHDFLIKCVHGHCNIIVSGETGAGKTEFVKYLAAHTKENEKVITIEDTLELHLDRIFPHRDIVAMKTNNIASYTDVLITCMRQNPKWILLSEVRSAEAVTAVRNSISSGHNILSTIHSDKAESIPHRMYSLLETNIDVDQFLKTIYRYIQLGVHIRARQDSETKRMHREVCEVIEFYVTQEGLPQHRILYKKAVDGRVIRNNPSEYLNDYLISQGITLTTNNNEVKDTMETKKNNNLENSSVVEVLEIN